jgi:hypothetical protein
MVVLSFIVIFDSYFACVNLLTCLCKIFYFLHNSSCKLFNFDVHFLNDIYFLFNNIFILSVNLFSHYHMMLIWWWFIFFMSIFYLHFSLARILSSFRPFVFFCFSKNNMLPIIVQTSTYEPSSLEYRPMIPGWIWMAIMCYFLVLCVVVVGRMKVHLSP